MSDPKPFIIEQPPVIGLDKAYLLLGARTPLELSQLYTAEDQKLMKSGGWDYENPSLITNKVKEELEAIDPASLSEEEREWRQEILWFWYHHAISSAIWIHKDREKAKVFAAKAMESKPEDSPNKITQLLFHLVNDELPQAEEWAKGIQEESEKSTAADLVREYKENSLGLS